MEDVREKRYSSQAAQVLELAMKIISIAFNTSRRLLKAFFAFSNLKKQANRSHLNQIKQVVKCDIMVACPVRFSCECVAASVWQNCNGPLWMPTCHVLQTLMQQELLKVIFTPAPGGVTDLLWPAHSFPTAQSGVRASDLRSLQLRFCLHLLLVHNYCSAAVCSNCSFSRDWWEASDCDG